MTFELPYSLIGSIFEEEKDVTIEAKGKEKIFICFSSL